MKYSYSKFTILKSINTYYKIICSTKKIIFMTGLNNSISIRKLYAL